MAKKRSGSKKKSRKYQIELTPLSIFLWGGCVFFVLAWIFVLGILVGRGFLPGPVTALSDLKNQLGVLPHKVGRDEPQQELEATKKSDSEPKLGFYDDLSSKKVEPLKEARAQNRAGTSSVSRLQKEETREPQASKGKYTVQLASLEDKNKAKKFIGDLVQRGYPAYFYEAKVKGKSYYRVRCGQFSSRKTAEDYASKLRREAGLKGFVSRIE
jgi:cell division septation protein DedD